MKLDEVSKTIEDGSPSKGILDEIEQKIGLDFDCRETNPTETKPDCRFMRCQIGKFGATREGEKTFHLMATASTWERALEVLHFRELAKLDKKT